MSNPYSDFALRFVEALVAEEFAAAHLMLSPSIQGSLSAAILEDEFSALAGYDGGKLTDIHLMETVRTWPAKESNDVCWCYFAISGRSTKHEGHISEAVAVVVADEENGCRVRVIEWGRP